jgi:hypothetical protein
MPPEGALGSDVSMEPGAMAPSQPAQGKKVDGATRLRWRDHVTVHPASDLLPMMDETQLAQLAEDVDAQGLRVPICLWRAHASAEWELIDGRNRLEVLAGLDDAQERIEQAIESATQYEGDKVDPWSFCISANIRRRHLTTKQKRELIVRLLKQDPARSDRAIADTVAADNKTVSAVRREAEAREEIPHVDTRIDVKGRSQPATKSAPPAPPVAVPVASPRRPRSTTRDQAVVYLSALLSRDVVKGLEDIHSVLRDEKIRIEKIALEKRTAFAAKFVAALGVDPKTLCTGHLAISERGSVGGGLAQE